MITFLQGILIESLPTQAIIGVNGVGYEVLIPLSSYDKLPPPGGEVRLLTHLVVREDAHTLYGFHTAAERELFRLLINAVSGIGPKLALNMLSGMSVEALKGAVSQSNVKALSRISGVGKKTAERVVVELKDKIGKSAASPSGQPGTAPTLADRRLHDAVMALVALGFKQNDAQSSVEGAIAVLGEQASVEDLVRASLKK